jgi:imidazolonepropionase
MAKKVDLIIANASQVVTPLGKNALRSPQMSKLHIIENGAVAVSGERITAVGATEKILHDYKAENVIDASGKVVTPGFVDCHTHIVFGGNRANEFEMRTLGPNYRDIALAGGGILSTVRATRQASEEHLKASALKRLSRMLSSGTTTIEIKSGYGLDIENELKMLRVIAQLGRIQPVDVVATFMGAHAVPDEYRQERAKYIRLLIDEMISEVARSKLAEFFDIFVEEDFFSVSESRDILNAAKEAGFKLKLHADQLTSTGGAQLAAEIGAISADHLVAIDEKGISALKKSRTVAVVLPGCTFFLASKRYAPAREMIDEGVAVALATDCNPGSCMIESFPLILTIACLYCGISPAEALTAATLNSACALDRGASIGSLETGKLADAVIWNVNHYREIFYFFGVNPVDAVIKRGKVVVGKEVVSSE